MAQRESTTAVVAALVGNLASAVLKFGAAAVTGSSAMVSEAIHSTVDTGNQVVLLVGLRRSGRPADRHHPFGYGKELYFWSLIVAVAFFGIGGGLSIYEGINHLQHPTPLESPVWNYVVLAGAALFEGISFVIGYRQFSKVKGDTGAWRAIRIGKDPSLFTVVVEDTMALIGLAVAFVAILLGHALDNVYFDGVGSLLIGLLLASAAPILIRESKGLLVGEAADDEVVAAIETLARDDPCIVDIGAPLTMQLGPERVLLNLEMEFVPGLTARQVRDAIDRFERRVHDRYPEVVDIFIEAASVTSGSDEETVGGETPQS